VSTPQRGEVWLIDLGLAAKVRPAVVVSIPAGSEDRALATFAPHTTSVRGTAHEGSVKVPYLKPGAFDIQGLVSVPFAKLERRLGRLTRDQQQAVDAALRTYLGLGPSSSESSAG
jgi:mRNA interferase MazF